MQLKQFYNIATKGSGRKNATTFGDLLDCLYVHGMNWYNSVSVNILNAGAVTSKKPKAINHNSTDLIRKNRVH